jgi:adenosylhomocysteinase
VSEAAPAAGPASPARAPDQAPAAGPASAGTRAASPQSDIADPGLAAAGLARIGWAERAMPALGQIRAGFAAGQPLAGLTVAACLHVTAETGALVQVLRAGGAQVHLAATNPRSTQDDVAAALAACPGATVSAWSGADRKTYYEHIHQALDSAPALVIDDGCDLVNTLHADRPELLGGVLGGCESTTTGVARLRRMAAAGTLAVPMVAANASETRRMLDNRYGTGQSAIDGIIRATNTLLAGKTVVVAGFGSAGTGIAERASGLGARVIVTEADPVRALDAALQGYQVLPMAAAAPLGEVFITATGSRDVVSAAHLAVMRDGAILANAGHFDVEIDVRGLAELAVAMHPEVRPHADEYVLADGRRLILLAEGRVVNLVAAEGHPAAVMDLSFAAQALVLAWLARDHARLQPGVHEVPAAIDAQIASLMLASLGAEIDALTPAQQEYLDSWRYGS